MGFIFRQIERRFKKAIVSSEKSVTLMRKLTK